MFLKQIHIKEFKALKNVHISLKQNDKSNVFSIASLNGLGKSTLLQFIFTMLHCSFDDGRKEYVKNLLEGLYPDILDDELLELAEFEIEDKKEIIQIGFVIVGNTHGGFNFDCFLDIPEIEEKLEELGELKSKLESLLKIQEEIRESGRVSSINRREIENYITDRKEQGMFLNSKSVKEAWSLVNTMIEKIKFKINESGELYKLLDNLRNKQEQLIKYLTGEGFSYALHLSNKKVLLCHSNVTTEYLKCISNKVFLIAPNTQVFLFLEREGREEIVNDYREYYEYIRMAKNELNGFFNYDFTSTDLIVEAFKKAIEKDSEYAIETGKYGNNLQKIQQELNEFLIGKKICINKELSKVNFKFTDSDKELLPEDLSHGELKKLGMYIWLKSHVANDSLVLMDEVDIGLHPKWQYELHEDLQKWSQDSQFILATHSPQIISSTHYKNLVILVKEGKSVCVKRYGKAPLDRDINTIIKVIMGAEYMPHELQLLQDMYRELFDLRQEETEQGKQLKQQILEYESEGSTFFQGISFDKELRE